MWCSLVRQQHPRGRFVSTAPVRHREPPRSSAAHPGVRSGHGRRSPAGPARRSTSAWAAAMIVAGAVALGCAGAAAAHWPAPASALAGSWLTKAAGGLEAWPAAWASQPQIVSAAVASTPGSGYRNPLRGVSGLVLERIDEGVDFAGVGPVHALGDAVVTGVTGTNFGWPGGGWITYRLTRGPAAGLVVYVSEDIIPAVETGQRVSSATVVGTMYNGGDGIETGWAQPAGLSAESQLPQAGAIGGYGPYPTRVGLNFDELLQSLGVPPAPNRDQPAHGLLPAGYPASWR